MDAKKGAFTNERTKITKKSFELGVLEGNRATVVQGAIYKSMGLTTIFAPSYRSITDLAGAQVHTALAGGPSDRRFSKWYATDILRWLNYGYKMLDGGK